jgi:hypothetical protein
MKNEERDAAIVAKRKEGRTLQSIADEYGLSRDSVRRIEAAWRREQRPTGGGLSIRARNGVLNALGRYRSEHYYRFTEAVDIKPALAAYAIAEIGEAALKGLPNVGVGTIREIKAWLAKYGQRLRP